MTRRDPDPIRALMRRARQERGWSLETASQKTGINTVVMGSWERGDRTPGLEQTRMWVRAFGFDLALLGPSDRVLSTNAANESYVVHVVAYGPNMDGVIECDSQPEAVAIASHMPGARVGHRVMRRGAVEFGGDW